MESIKSKNQYKKPTVTTYTEEEILELIGPANTGGSDVSNMGLHLGWEKGKGNPHRI